MVLEKKFLDHGHILLLEHGVDHGPYPFRLFHSWFDIEGFEDVFRGSWTRGVDSKNPWVIFKKNLQFLKSNIIVWNSCTRDKIGAKRRELQDLLEFIDKNLVGNDGSASL